MLIITRGRNAETKPCLDIGDYTGTAGEAIKVQDTLVNHFPLLIRTIMTICGTGYAVASKGHGVTQHT